MNSVWNSLFRSTSDSLVAIVTRLRPGWQRI